MKKFLMMTVLGLCASLASMAQGDCCKASKSHSFIELQGGLQWTATNAKIDKLLMPVGAVSIGHYFTPEVGARLHVSGLKAKGRFEGMDLDYKWNYLTSDADVLLNLSNLFSKSKSHGLNVILVAGVGLVNYGKHEELQKLSLARPTDIATVVTSSSQKEWSKNLRGGLRLETNLNKPFGISLELDANNLHDEFNGKLNGSDDWMFSGMIGLSWRFGFKKCKKAAPATEPAPIVEEPTPIPAPAVRVPDPEPRQYVRTETLHEEIFYLIRLSDPTESGSAQMRRVADFMKKYPMANVTIVGYADKGTGNAELNQMYSERRAAECKDALVNVYGCEASRISTSAMGDRVQPFIENDKNRCVIIDAKGEYTVIE